MTHNTERLSDENLIRALVDLDQEHFNSHLDTWFERGGSLYYLADCVYHPPKALLDALDETQQADYRTLLLRNFCIVQHKDVLNLKKQMGCIQAFLFSEKID